MELSRGESKIVYWLRKQEHSSLSQVSPPGWKILIYMDRRYVQGQILEAHKGLF